jgi:predicted RNA-binding protein with PUA domain
MVAGEKKIPVRRSPIKVRQAFPADMPFIREHVERFRLDDEDMDYHQFVVSVEDDKVVGLGRIRLHGEVVELAALALSKGRGTEVSER